MWASSFTRWKMLYGVRPKDIHAFLRRSRFLKKNIGNVTNEKFWIRHWKWNIKLTNTIVGDVEVFRESSGRTRVDLLVHLLWRHTCIDVARRNLWWRQCRGWRRHYRVDQSGRQEGLCPSYMFLCLSCRSNPSFSWKNNIVKDRTLSLV